MVREMRSVLAALCVVAVMGCGEDSGGAGQGDAQGDGQGTNSNESPPISQPVISYCPRALGAGQPETREVVGLWQQCEGPRERGGCTVLDDDGILLRSDGTFAIVEAAVSGSLEAGEQVCVYSLPQMQGLYRWADNKLTLVPNQDQQVAFSEGFCEAPFIVTGQTADWTNRFGNQVPYVRLDESRICGECVRGGESRCP